MGYVHSAPLAMRLLVLPFDQLDPQVVQPTFNFPYPPSVVSGTQAKLLERQCDLDRVVRGWSWCWWRQGWGACRRRAAVTESAVRAVETPREKCLASGLVCKRTLTSVNWIKGRVTSMLACDSPRIAAAKPKPARRRSIPSSPSIRFTSTDDIESSPRPSAP